MLIVRDMMALRRKLPQSEQAARAAAFRLPRYRARSPPAVSAILGGLALAAGEAVATVVWRSRSTWSAASDRSSIILHKNLIRPVRSPVS